MGLTTSREDLRTYRNIIYRMYNTLTHMSYVGQTRRTFYQRYRGRWWNRTDNTYIRRAVKKYGHKAFYVEILEHDVPNDHLDDREIYWVKHFQSVAPNGYNLNTGGRKHHTAAESLRRKRGKLMRDAHRKQYLLVKDGREYCFTSIVGFANRMGLSKNLLSRVLRGEGKQHRGFHLKERDIRLRCKTHSVRYLEKDGIIYEVHNVSVFAKDHGLREDVVSQLFRGKTRVHRGFHLPDLKPLEPRKPMRPKISTVVLINDRGEELVVPNERRREFCEHIGIDLYSLMCGRRKTSRGYSIQRMIQ